MFEPVRTKPFNPLASRLTFYVQLDILVIQHFTEDNTTNELAQSTLVPCPAGLAVREADSEIRRQVDALSK